jgi:hypothetical protein
MKKIWLPVATLIGGAAAGVLVGLLLPIEKRAQLSQRLAVNLEQMCARIPDE